MRLSDLRGLLRGDMAHVHRVLGDTGQRGPLRRALAWLRRRSEASGAHAIALPACPPLALLWAWHEGGHEQSPAVVVHRAFLGEAWRERGGLARTGALLRLALLWLPVNLTLAAWASALHARAVARRTGKGLLRQLAEQLSVLCAHDIRAVNYYGYELFDDARRARARDYLQRSEMKGGVYLLMKRFLPASSKLANKLRFAERCSARGIRTIPLLAVAERGELRLLRGDALPRADLFVKPNDGRGGVGADWWAWDAGALAFRNSSGQTIAERDFPAHVAKLSESERYLVSPRLVPHSALTDLSEGVLSTVRIVTVLNERGEPEATDAVFRMSTGANRIVDNFHAGGLAAQVDLETGALARATDIGLRPDVGWRELHPNGAPITGRRLPFWPDAVELCRRAHAAFADRVAIGWDVALLDDGPCLVEGNGGPDLDIHQRCSGVPVGATRLGELLALHTRRALAARAEREGSFRSG